MPMRTEAVYDPVDALDRALVAPLRRRNGDTRRMERCCSALNVRGGGQRHS